MPGDFPEIAEPIRKISGSRESDLARIGIKKPAGAARVDEERHPVPGAGIP